MQEGNIMARRMLSKVKAAKILGISTPTLKKWMSTEIIPSLNGRVDIQDVLALKIRLSVERYCPACHTFFKKKAVNETVWCPKCRKKVI